MKPKSVKITQILTQGSGIMGLGDDGKLYRYDYANTEWVNP